MKTADGTSTPQSIRGTEVPSDVIVATDRFITSPSAFFNAKLHDSYPRIALLVAGIIVITIGIATLIDKRVYFAGVMLLFVIAPMIMAYIYFKELLTYNAYLALSPKRVKIDSERNIIITYEKRDENNEEEPPPAQPQRINGSEVKQIRELGNYILIEADTIGYPLIIPITAFPINYDYHSLLDY